MPDNPPPSRPSDAELPSGPPVGPPPGPPPPRSEAGGPHTTPWVVPGGSPPRSAPPEDPDDRRRRRGPLLAAAIVGVLVLVIASVAFVDDDSGDEPGDAAARSTTTDPDSGPSSTEPAPSTTAPALPPVSEEEFLALVDELQAYVAAVRGLEFREDVTVELAEGAEFEARLLEDFEEDLDEIEDSEVFYRALGLLRPDVSLADALRSIYAVGVLGFYDPETNELVVRGRSTTPYVRQTIVHELVHALDDQHFELHRPAYEDAKDEISAGFRSVVEGNARRVDNRWTSDQPSEVREQIRTEEQSYVDDIDISAFPEILWFELQAPYQLGEVFVGEQLDQGGERSVDAAVVDPPETTEQVLFPHLYDERQPRVEVPPPPADGEVVDDGVIGALFLLGLLSLSDSAVNQSDAFRAVEGWGGDWAVTWTDGDQACVRADFVGDTPGDTEELRSALERWAEDRTAAQVSEVDERVRLESCGAAGGGGSPQV